MSEAERHWLRNRLLGGKLARPEQGELRMCPPPPGPRPRRGGATNPPVGVHGLRADRVGLGGLEPVEPGHLHVEQDDRELPLGDCAQRFFPGVCLAQSHRPRRRTARQSNLARLISTRAARITTDRGLPGVDSASSRCRRGQSGQQGLGAPCPIRLPWGKRGSADPRQPAGATALVRRATPSGFSHAACGYPSPGPGLRLGRRIGGQVGHRPFGRRRHPCPASANDHTDSREGHLTHSPWVSETSVGVAGPRRASLGRALYPAAGAAGGVRW